MTPEWTNEFSELVANAGLDQLLASAKQPTFDEVYQQLATSELRLTTAQISAVLDTILKGWWQENTTLYYMLRKSIDLDGVFYESDMEHIKEHYWHGAARDGIGLYQWATGHVNAASIAGQSKLMDMLLSMKLPSNPSLEAFTQHCTGLLLTWKKITTNDIRQPASFYFRLLHSFPAAADGTKAGMLRSYLAGLMAEDSPELRNVPHFIDQLIKRAELLGLSTGGAGQQGQGVFAGLGKDTAGGEKKRGNCKLCRSTLCNSLRFGGQPQHCLVLGKKTAKPKGASDGQLRFLEQSRAYAQQHKITDSIKHVKASEIREWAKSNLTDSKEKTMAAVTQSTAPDANALNTNALGSDSSVNAAFAAFLLAHQQAQATGTKEQVTVIGQFNPLATFALQSEAYASYSPFHPPPDPDPDEPMLESNEPSQNHPICSCDGMHGNGCQRLADLRLGVPYRCADCFPHHVTGVWCNCDCITCDLPEDSAQQQMPPSVLSAYAGALAEASIQIGINQFLSNFLAEGITDLTGSHRPEMTDMEIVQYQSENVSNDSTHEPATDTTAADGTVSDLPYVPFPTTSSLLCDEVLYDSVPASNASVVQGSFPTVDCGWCN